MAIVLLSTEACHLCELAQQVLIQVHQQLPLEVYFQDIAEDEAMVENYGTRIPVLLDENTGSELGWPFDVDSVLNWLEKTSTMKKTHK